MPRGCSVIEVLATLKREVGEHGFVSLERMREIMTPDNIYSILLESSQQVDVEIISTVVENCLKLLTTLVLMQQQRYLEELLYLGIDDEIFAFLKPEGHIQSSNGSVVLLEVGPPDFPRKLYETHWMIPPPFAKPQVSLTGIEVVKWPQNYIPPFYKSTNNTHDASSAVEKLVVGGGHLNGCSTRIAVAVKRVRVQSSREDPLWEASALCAREHSHVVPLLTSYIAIDNDDQDFLYLLMPYAPGGDMNDWMRSEDTPNCPPSLKDSPCTVVGFIYESILALVSALAHIHSDLGGYRMGHFDIKPANILLFEQNGKWIWKFCDFGHSRRLSAHDSIGTDRPLGTFEYQPPEYGDSVRDTIFDLSFDIFSMGCIIIELATLIAFRGWKCQRVNEFEKQRSLDSNPFEDRKDNSFRNNMRAVHEWIDFLNEHDGSKKLESLLRTALEMIIHNPKERPMAFDAALDIWGLVYPDKKQGDFEKECRRLVSGQGPRNRRLSFCYDPLLKTRTSERYMSRTMRNMRATWLVEEGWIDPLRTSASRATLAPPRKKVSFTNLPTTFVPDSLDGRDKEIDLLESYFKDPGSGGQYGTCTVGIHGLGGMGKSHLAWQYAWNLRKDAEDLGKTIHTFWVQARNTTAFRMGYGDIARSIDKPKDVQQDDPSSVLRWLKDSKNGPWILVLDGVTEARAEWDRWCPWGSERILLTTKDRAISGYYCNDHRYSIELKNIDPRSGVGLLRKLIPNSSPEDIELAEQLVSKLQLPLLVKLSGQHIARNIGGRLSIAKMCQKICSRSGMAAFVGQHNVQQVGFEELNPDTNTIFDVLFEPFRKQYKHYAVPFRLMCCFSKDGISRGLIEKQFEEPEDIERIFSALTNACYLENVSNEHYTAHEVVQTMFLRWRVHECGPLDVWEGYMRALLIIGSRYQKEKDEQEKGHGDTGISIYLLKLRYKIHMEEFLEYLKANTSISAIFRGPASQAVVTFARMFRDENRFSDAELLLRRVIDQGVEIKKDFEDPHIVLKARRALIETHRASASGRYGTKALKEALEQTELAIGQAKKEDNVYFLLRLLAIRIDVLCSMGACDEADKTFETMKTTNPLDQDEKEAVKQEIRVLWSSALICRSRGKAECNLHQLQESRNHLENLYKTTEGSPYGKLERKDRLDMIGKEYASTCLNVLVVLTGKKLKEDDIGQDAYKKALDIYHESFRGAQKAYETEGKKYQDHKHVQDAKLDLGTTVLRHGLWEQDVYQIKDSVKTFGDVLEKYTEKLRLEKTDKDVRNCAYLLREGLHYLAGHEASDHGYISRLETLEKKYDLIPWDKTRA